MLKRLIAAMLLAVTCHAQDDEEYPWICQTCPSISRGLVAYWSFQNNTTNDSYLAHHLTVDGAVVSFANGLAGGGALFDGINDQIWAADNNDLSFNGTTDAPFSMSFWVYKNNTNDGGVFAKLDNTTAGNAEWTTYTGSMRPQLAIYDNTTANNKTFSLTPAMTTGTWNHVVFAFDGSSTVGYLNGNLGTIGVVTTGTYVAMHNTTIPVRLGVAISANVTYRTWLSGRLDEVRIYNVALNQREVTSLYRAGAFLKNIGR